MFVLAHLSDAHLAPLPAPPVAELLSKRGLGYLNWLRKRRRIHRPDVLAAVVADLKAQGPSHIAFTGDLVNLSLSNEFAPAFAWLERLGTPADVTFVPGNHDAYVQAATGYAQRHWGAYMHGDAGESFPFVRRRGPLALIGLTTALPTLPLAATGRLGEQQLARLGELLAALKDERVFRVILLHHPPHQSANRFRRLVDAAALREVLRKHGADLVLHGHHHESTVVWLSGPKYAIPCVGVPSASGSPTYKDDPGGYHLYEIDDGPDGWRCTARMRAVSRDGGGIDEVMRTELGS
jgi:3',5'-cyclic AMP phosphodiesterase CpdA